MRTRLFEYINRDFVENTSDESNQLLQTISGYIQEPLLPLETACMSLVSIISCLEVHL